MIITFSHLDHSIIMIPQDLHGLPRVTEKRYCRRANYPPNPLTDDGITDYPLKTFLVCLRNCLRFVHDVHPRTQQLHVLST